MTLETFGATSANWLWNQFGKQLVEKTMGEIKKKWEEFRWEEAEILYLLNLQEQHATTRLLGYPKPIKITETYTDIFVYDKPSAHKHLSIDELASFGSEEYEPTSAKNKKTILRFIKNEKRLYILGKPGAGKTTLLKYLTLCACDDKIDKTPIYISLKEWEDSGLELLPFVVQLFDICSFPDAQAFIENLLSSDQALVLFDGLDEINQEGGKRTKLIRLINNFSKKYKNAQIIITCRIG